MNKKLVDALLPAAEQAIITTKIANDDREIQENFRSQVSSFGAAITTGSLLAAVAFFSEQRASDTDRPKILKAICLMLRTELKVNNNNPLMVVQTVGEEDSLFEMVKAVGTDAADIQQAKEKILACAVALKLAINLFHIKIKEKADNKKKDDREADAVRLTGAEEAADES